MAFETKAILALLAESVGRASTIREAYNFIAAAANAEGANLASYDDFVKRVEKEKELSDNDSK